MDQIDKIHNVLGTPTTDVLADFQSKTKNIEVNFAAKEGTGIDRLIPHVSPHAKNLISKMLTYK